ncbi:MAG: BadF/BadG/BcrA/BcrD ATPase family protein [Candidatus Bipolaricaulaceae bacterium]
MSYVLGVDAGNSKTFALVAASDGRVLGFGRAGPGNHQTVGLGPALGEIQRACVEACAQAGVRLPVTLGVFGLAGADLPEDFELLRTHLAERSLAHRIRVENDTLVALRAGTRRPWGVVVVCGAGFNAAGIAPDGRVFRLPGLGWISGDRGGGAFLAQEAVRHVARAWDGRGDPTLLTPLVLQALGLTSVEELIVSLYHGRVEESKLLGLVPQIFEAAYAGDRVAQQLLVQLGEEVGCTAGASIRRLGLEQTDVEVVLAGGVFKGKGPLLWDTITQVVHRTAPRAQIVRPPFAPVVGAVLLALEEIRGFLEPEIRENLERSLPAELRE